MFQVFVIPMFTLLAGTPHFSGSITQLLPRFVPIVCRSENLPDFLPNATFDAFHVYEIPVQSDLSELYGVCFKLNLLTSRNHPIIAGHYLSEV